MGGSNMPGAESQSVNSVQSHGLPVSSWEDLLQTAEPEGHFVQFYDADERYFAKSVSRYLLNGLQRGDGILVIATKAHRDAFVRRLRGSAVDPDAAIRQGTFLLLDAQETLAAFMVGGQPDWNRFDRTIGGALREIRARTPQAGLRAFGAMVGLLWKMGRYAAAVRVEQFWNNLLPLMGFNLFCAYPIDVFGPEFQISGLDSLLCAHTHLLPAGRDRDLERAIDRAVDERLGSKAGGPTPLTKPVSRATWAAVPRAEATVLWLRNNLPDQADDILAQARQYYRASAAAA